MPKAKPYSGPVDKKTAIQLLNGSGESFDGMLLGESLIATAEKLELLVTKANAFLQDNEFAKVMAEYLAMKVNRRGASEILVSSTGQVLLDIQYEEIPTRPTVLKRQRRVPLLEDLRAEAKQLGLDITRFGIKRKAIYDYLEKVRAQKPEGTRRSVSVVKIAEDQEDHDPGPMANGPDETKLTSALDEARPPRKRGFVKTQDALSGPVVVDEGSERGAASAPKPPAPSAASKQKSLRQLVEASKEVNITDLLSSDPPEQ
jgi:hypothetical protein